MAPPGDPPEDQQPNTDPPPDPNTDAPTVADLQAQLATANERAQAATEASVTGTRDALRAANPNLPDAAFTGETVEALNTTVNAHRETATTATTQAETDARNRAAGLPAPAGGTTRTPQIPDGLRGSRKIAYALQHPGPGSTE